MSRAVFALPNNAVVGTPPAPGEEERPEMRHIYGLALRK